MFARQLSKVVLRPAIGLGAAVGGWSLLDQTAYMSVGSMPEVMTPDGWVPLKLLKKEELTAGERPTMLYTFELSKNQDVLPVSSALLTRAPCGTKKETGEPAFVMRPYTPVSTPESKQLELAIKIYPDGKLTQYMSTMKPGDVLDFKGPLVKIPMKDAAAKKEIGMVAGGTGITPMLQMADELLRTGYKGKISLIYANVSPGDIMLKDRVDGLAKKYANFSVYYMVDKVPKGESWSGGEGYVTKDVLSAHMPKPGKDSLILVCGPPPMMKVISGAKVSPKEQGPLEGLLKTMGYTESQVFKY